jgi:hypothetical protein
MRRIPTLLCAAALGAITLVGCGSDESTDGAGGDNAGTSGGGDTEITLPDSIPGVSDDCRDLYQRFATAMGSIGTGAPDDLDEVFGALEDVVPEELKDDAKVLAEAFGKYSEVLAKYDNDLTKAMTDPEAMAALEELGTDEVNEASTVIGDYLDDTCAGS